MAYKIENLGGSFDNKAIKALEERLNSNEATGWEFDSVFMIVHKTCLGLSSTNTYLAIFKSRVSATPED